MNKTTKLVYTAVLSALCVLANIFSIPIYGSNFLSFVYLPCFIAGIYLGALSGGCVGLIGDVLGHFISPKGDYNFLIGLSCILLGVLPALIFKIPRISKYLKLALSILVCAIICTSGLNTLGLWLAFSSQTKTFWVYLAGRLPFQIIMFGVNATIMNILLATNLMPKLMHLRPSKANSNL